MNNISVTPKGGTVATQLSGSDVNLTAPAVVKLNLNQSDIHSLTRSGNDLVVTAKSGEKVVIHNFFSPAGESDLVLQDERGALWWVENPGQEEAQFISIDSTEGLLADETTNNGAIAAYGVGGAALAGLAAVFAGSGGDSDSGRIEQNSDDNNDGDTGSGNNGSDNSGGADTTAPDAVTDFVIRDNTGSIQGNISTGSTTDDNTPVLSGSAEAGATISIYDGGTLTGTVTVGADGRWSFTSPLLADGQHSLTVRVTDAAGNSSRATDPINFLVDTLAPGAITQFSVTSDKGLILLPVAAESATSDNTPVLRGNAEAGSIITITDGDTVLGTVIAGSDGGWQFTTPALGEGSHTLSITASDAAGNVSPATTFTFSVDTIAPDAATGLQLIDNEGDSQGPLTSGDTTDDNTPVLSGQAEPGALLTLYDGETLLGSVTVDSEGNWSITPSALSNGSHSLTATVTDAAGNVSPPTDPIDITVAASLPPAVLSLEITDDSGSTLVRLPDGSTTSDNTPTLSGVATANALVTLYDGDTLLGSVIADGSGQWVFTPTTLPDGTYAFRAVSNGAETEVDETPVMRLFALFATRAEASDTSETPTMTITIDTLAPDAAGNLQLSDDNGSSVVPINPGGTTNDNTPLLSGTAEPNSTISLLDGGTLLASTTADSDGNWGLNTPPLTDGSHSLSAVVTDAAGNVSSPTDAFEVNISADLSFVPTSLVVTDDSGSAAVQLSAGGNTQDNTPVLSGETSAGALVTLYNGDQLLGSVTADGAGQWSFTPDTLADGTYNFHASSTDAAGNSFDSGTLTVTIDTVAPQAVTDLQLSSDTSGTPVSVTSGATSDTTPALSGRAEPGGIITISDGATILGSTTAGEDGAWSFTTPALPAGEHNLTATVTDPAGNTSTSSAPVSFTVDTTPPAAATDLMLDSNNGVITVPIAPGSATNDTSPVGSGTAELGSVVTILDGSDVLGSTTVDSGGSWRFTTPALAEGSHSLTTTVTDPAGNTGPLSDSLVFTVDTTPPAMFSALTVTDDVGGIQGVLSSGDTTDDRAPTLSGQAEPNAFIRIYDGDTLLGNVTVDTDGSWYFTTPLLSNGSHSLSFTVTDAAGNLSPASDAFALTVEGNLPPATTSLEATIEEDGTLRALTDGASTHQDSLILSGLAGPGSLVTLYDGNGVLGSVTADGNGQWTFTPEVLADGIHAFRATFTDADGMTDAGPLTVRVDTVAPEAADNLQLSNDEGSVVTPIAAGGATSDATPVLSGTAEPGSSVTISDGATVLGSATVNADGSWRFTLPALDEGGHSLTTTVTDIAGNVSAASSPLLFTLDITPPAAATGLRVSDNVGDSQGALTSGTTTDDDTPLLSGQAEAGGVVSLYDGDVLLGTVTAGTDGNWSLTTAALSNGNHSLTVTVTDAAGNVSLATPAFNINVQASLPAATTSLEATDDSGPTLVALTDGDATRDSTPVLSGLVTAGSLVTIYSGDTALGSVTADGNGQWVYTTDTLADGTYSFRAAFTDATGNVADSAQLTLTIDTTAPDAATDITLSDANGDPIGAGAANNNTPVLSGSAEPGSTVTLSDGNTPLGTVTAGDDGSWRFVTPPLTEGDHSLTAIVTDPAGNTSPASEPVAIVVDTQAPATAADLTVSSDQSGETLPVAPGGATSDTTPVLSGSAEAGGIVTVYDGDNVLGSVTADDAGNWRYATPALNEGEHSLTAIVTDAAGNSSAASPPVSVTVDITAPEAAGNLQLSSDRSGAPVAITGGVTNDPTPILSGTAEPGGIITVSDGDTVLGSVVTDSDGNWVFTTPALSEGDHNLTATVTDAAGNSSPAAEAIALNVSTIPPEAAEDLLLTDDRNDTVVLSGGLTGDATPVLSGTAAAGGTVTVSDGDNVLGTTGVDADGNWRFTTPALDDGAHSLTVTVTDTVGNISAPSAALNFTTDTQPPVAVTDLALSNDQTGTAITAGGVTNDITPFASGTAEPGGIVTLFDGETELGSATADGDGNWSVTSSTLEAGEHSLSVTVTDAAGNTGPSSAPFTFTLDLTPPATATNLQLSNDDSGVPAVIATGSATNDVTPLLSGSADAGSTITVSDGDTVLGTATVDSNGNWRFSTPALSEGPHSLNVIVTNPSGNSSVPSEAIAFTVDNSAPALATGIELSSDNNGDSVIAEGSTTSDATPVLAGSAEAGGIITVADGARVLGSATVDADGNWRFTSPALAEGDHSLIVTVTDPAGNVSAPSEPFGFSVDLTAPAVADNLQLSDNSGTTLLPVAEGGYTSDNTPELTGTAEADSIVTVYDGDNPIGSVAVGAEGDWSFIAPALADGDHSLSVTVTDAAGNVSNASAAIGFTVDTTAPDATALTVSSDAGIENVTLTPGAYTNDNMLLIAGVAEANSLVTIYEGDVVIGTATASDNGEWSLLSPALADGEHTLSATVTDGMGNLSARSDAFTFNVDTMPPEPATALTLQNSSGVALADGAVTNDNVPVLSGRAEANSIVRVYDGTALLGSVATDGEGNWRYTPGALTETSHTLSVTVTDAAGNVSAGSSALSVTVDTTAPAATTLAIYDSNGTTQTAIANGGSTNDQTPVLRGSVEAGATVNIYQGGALIGTATVNENGTWRFETGTLAEGEYAFTASVTDAAGNTSIEAEPYTINVDITAPAAIDDLLVNDDGGLNGGPLASGATTDDNAPTLSGTAEPGSTVTVYDGDTLLGTAVTTAEGGWEFTPATLSNGTHSLTVTQTDAAGNISPASDAFQLTIANALPPTTSTLQVTDDSGSTLVTLSEGASTRDTTPLLSGLATEGDIITISDGDTVLGSTTVGASGVWNFTPAALAEGRHSFTITTVDAAGNAGESAGPVAIVIDTTAPATVTDLLITEGGGISVDEIANGDITNENTPLLSGTAEANALITIYDGDSVIGSTTADGTGAWDFTSPLLNDGAHALSVTVTDTAGNQSDRSAATGFTVDTIEPAAAANLVVTNDITSTGVPDGGATSDSSPALSGIAEAGSLVTLYDGDRALGSVTADANGAWRFITPTLADATHALSARVTDTAGNASAPSATVTVVVDTLAPAAVTLTATNNNGATEQPIADNSTTNDSTPMLAGTAEVGSRVTISDGATVLGSVTAGSDGRWSFTTPTLGDGAHTLNVTATDAAGHVSTPTSLTLTVTTVAPAPVAALTVAANAGATQGALPHGGDSTPLLSGTAEAGSLVRIYNGSTLLGSVTADAGGAWSLTPATALSDGAYTLSVTVTDAAGNISGTTAASLVVDTTPPAAVTLTASNNNGSTPVTIPDGGVTSDSTPQLSGSGEVGAQIRVYDGAALLGTTRVGSNGQWSFITPTLGNGVHTLNVTATDAAGNLSPNAAVRLTVDTVVPSASTLVVTNDAVTPNVTVPGGGSTRDTTPVLSGTAEAGAIVSVYDGTALLGTVTVGSGGNWSFTSAVLANGTHPLSVTVTDAAGNVSGATSASVIVDTVAPAAVTGLALNTAGTTLTGSGEAGATVTVRDAGGTAIGTGTVAANGSFSVTLTTAQTTGATLSVTQTDRAGNVSPGASVLGAIRVAAVNDVNDVDYTTTAGSITNPNSSFTSGALLSVNLGTLLSANVLNSTNAYIFNVGADDTRSVTLHASATSLAALTANYTLYLYQQQADGSWALRSSTANYITTLLTIGTQTGANVTYSNLGTGNYAVLLGTSTGVGVLPTTTVTTTSDITYMAVTVAATVTGNLLANDTSSEAGTVPASALVTTVSGSAISSTGNTVINTTWGTLTVDSKGDYTYTLKAGLDADTVPATDVFSYSVRDASGTVTSATLTVDLYNGAATTLAVNTLFTETSAEDGTTAASGSIYGDSTASHSGTLSITNEQGDTIRVSSAGTTLVAGDYGTLSIAADGHYTYALSADLNVQTMTHKETFSYSLAATDGTITTNTFTIELHPTITGTASADALTSSAYDDTITAGAGADNLVYHLLNSADAVGGNGQDSWTDFSVADGDKIDVSSLLVGWNDSSDINDFVKVDHTADGNTVLSIDRDGSGTAYSSTQLITLEGVNVSLEELLQQPHQTLTT